jgi:hypothetical protein
MSELINPELSTEALCGFLRAVAEKLDTAPILSGEVFAGFVHDAAIRLEAVIAERDRYKDALADLQDTAGELMMPDEPTDVQRRAFLDAWTAAGELLEGGAR